MNFFVLGLGAALGVLSTYAVNYFLLPDWAKTGVSQYIGMHFPGLILILVMTALVIVMSLIMALAWNKSVKKAQQELKHAEEKAKFIISQAKDDAYETEVLSEGEAKQRIRKAEEFKERTEREAKMLLAEAKNALADIQKKRDGYLQEIDGLRIKIKRLSALLIKAKAPLLRKWLDKGAPEAAGKVEKMLRREIGSKLYDAIIAEMVQEKILR